MRRIWVGFVSGICFLAIAATGMAADKGPSTPCRAVIEFMKKGRTIVKQLSGDERSKRIDELKREYTDRMKDAPAKAKSAAESYLRHLQGYLDGKTPDAGHLILIDRNNALKACGTNPSEAGL